MDKTNRKHLLSPNRKGNIHFKNKQKRDKKKKAIKNLSQVVCHPENTKISYLSSPCGMIECVETDNSRRWLQLGSNQFSVPNSSRGLKVVKPKNNCVKMQKSVNHKITALHPKSSIVIMTHNNNVDNCGSAILGQCSEKTNNNDAVSLLESLMLTGTEAKKTSSSEAETYKLIGGNTLSTTQKDSKNLSNQNVKSSVICGLNEIKNHTNNDKTTSSNFTNSPLCSIVMNVCGKNTAINFYELSCSKFLVLMKPGSNLFLIGSAKIQLVEGKIEVMGYSSYKENEELLLFSLQGSCHLLLQAKEKNAFLSSEHVSDKNLFEKLIVLGLPEPLSNKIAKKAENSVLFTISRNKSDVSSTVWPKFFENHSSYCIFPPAYLMHNVSRPCHNVERTIDCLFETNLQELGLKEFVEIPEWAEIESCFLKQDYPKAVISGGKSVGKSTFLRYLINKCLFKCKQILVLDFDLGQCEFTVPGCISATIVEEPLLGPNYSHLKKPKRSVFLGEVSVTKCPENYIEGCKLLINYAKEKHSHIPWLINTMGFTKGFGVGLACGIINYVNPTHVIQIQSKDGKLNFPSLLEPKFVSCLKHSAFDMDDGLRHYQLYVMPSGPEQQGGFYSKSRGISPAESRNLVILSYLSQMLNADMSNLSQVIPYMISMEQVDLQTTNKYNLTKAQIAAAMNGNMVALCHKSPSNEFHNCLGFGIVRGIDWQSGTIFLITPLPQNELTKVNCLVKGNVALPDSLHYNQGDQVKGHVPYLAYTSARSTARFAKRDFRNLPATPRSSRLY